MSVIAVSDLLAKIRSWYGDGPSFDVEGTFDELIVVAHWLIDACGHGQCPTGKTLQKAWVDFDAARIEVEAWRSVMGWEHDESAFGSVVVKHVVSEHSPGFDRRLCVRCRVEAAVQARGGVCRAQ